ncbi:MAG: preprotein translocase subunit YajC [Lentisphaerae bacterium]|nr:preprotein translocase subunit YajC [Lentisphaerota bacterium]
MNELLTIAQQQKPQSFTQGLVGMLPFIIVIGAMFFLMWRGQAKEKKRREEMMNSIMQGTKIMTIGGLYGIVDSVNGNIYKVKIADNVKIEIDKNGIASVVKDEKAAEPAAKDEKAALPAAEEKK